ncbi:MAG: hypothetical protein V3U92_19565 [Cellulophaga sp.]
MMITEINVPDEIIRLSKVFEEHYGESKFLKGEKDRIARMVSARDGYISGMSDTLKALKKAIEKSDDSLTTWMESLRTFGEAFYGGLLQELGILPDVTDNCRIMVDVNYEETKKLIKLKPDPKNKHEWECRKHGDKCKSYVKGIVKELNEKGLSPVGRQIQLVKKKESEK